MQVQDFLAGCPRTAACTGGGGTADPPLPGFPADEAPRWPSPRDGSVVWFDGLAPFVAPDAKGIHQSLRGQSDALYNIQTLSRALDGYRKHVCPTLCYEGKRARTDADATATARAGRDWLASLGTDPTTRKAQWWRDRAMDQLRETLGGSPEACDAMAAASPAHLPRRAEAPAAACEDISAGCENYAAKGECDHNPSWMKINCRKSCGFCAGEANLVTDGDGEGDEGCRDAHEHCADWAAKGECDANPGYMLTSCAKSCNQCGAVLVDAGGEAVLEASEGGVYQRGEWRGACALFREYVEGGEID